MVAPDFEVVRTFPRLEEHASRLRRSVYYMYMYGFYRKRVLEAAQALYVVGADSRARGLEVRMRARYTVLQKMSTNARCTNDRTGHVVICTTEPAM